MHIDYFLYTAFQCDRFPDVLRVCGAGGLLLFDTASTK